MRVLICSDPGSIHTRKLVRGLTRRVEVGVYYFGETEEWQYLSVPMFPVFPKRQLKLPLLWRISDDIALLSTLVAFRPSVVHVHVNAGLCRELKRWAPNTPVVFTAWGHAPKEALSGSFGKNLTNANGLTGDSQALLEEMWSVPGCRTKPGTLFRFGVDGTVFKPGPAPEKMRSDLGLPADCRIVFSPRSLRPGYNHETLVKAMPLVLDQVPNANFVFVNNHGHRYADAAEYRQRLEAQIQSVGVANRVRFLDHMVEQERVADVFRAADVAVSICLEDGFPATIFEAMGCGTPLVLSNLRDYEDVIDGSNAMLVEPADHIGLAIALVDILTNPTVASRLRHAGLKTVSAKGDLEREIDRLLDFYVRIGSSTSPIHR